MAVGETQTLADRILALGVLYGPVQADPDWWTEREREMSAARSLGFDEGLKAAAKLAEDAQPAPETARQLAVFLVSEMNCVLRDQTDMPTKTFFELGAEDQELFLKVSKRLISAIGGEAAALRAAGRRLMDNAGWDGERNPTPDRDDWEALREALTLTPSAAAEQVQALVDAASWTVWRHRAVARGAGAVRGREVGEVQPRDE